MSEPSLDSRWGEGVRLSQPRLRQMEFDWRGAAEPGTVPRFQFGMELYRHSAGSLGVDFTVTAVDAPGLTAQVTYGVLFEIEEGSPEGREPERALRMLAARVAPVTLYPFCREMLVSTAQRAGLTDFVLPVSNVGALWTLEEIPLPDPPPGGEAGTGAGR